MSGKPISVFSFSSRGKASFYGLFGAQKNSANKCLAAFNSNKLSAMIFECDVLSGLCLTLVFSALKHFEGNLYHLHEFKTRTSLKPRLRAPHCSHDGWRSSGYYHSTAGRPKQNFGTQQIERPRPLAKCNRRFVALWFFFNQERVCKLTLPSNDNWARRRLIPPNV